MTNCKLPAAAAALTFLSLHIEPLAAAITWDGSSGAFWNTPANWDLNRVPDSTEEVIFPAAGATKVMTNNRPAGTAFRQLTFQAGGYSVTGNRLTLATSGAAPRIRTTHPSGTVVLDVHITLQNTATLEAAGTGTLLLDSGADVQMGTNTLNCDVDGTLVVESTLSGSGALNVLGAGTVDIRTIQAFTGLTSVTGSLLLSGSLPGSVTTFNGSTVLGTGSMGGDFTSNGGTVNPGDAQAGSTGIFTVNGAFTQNTAGTKRLIFDIKGSIPGSGHDQITCGAGLTLRNTVVEVRPAQPQPPGTRCALVQGDLDKPAEFSGLTAPDGSPLTAAPHVVGMSVVDFAADAGFRSLVADFVMPETALSQCLWTGAGADSNLLTPANWSAASGFSTPAGGCALTFSSSAPSNRRTVTNNSGGTVRELLFTAPGYVMQQSAGAPPLYVHSLRVNHSGGGTTTVNAPVAFHRTINGLNDAEIRNLSAQPLIFGSEVTLAPNTGLEVHQAVSGADAFVRLSGGLSAGSVRKTGAGRLELSSGSAMNFSIEEGEARLTGLYGLPTESESIDIGGEGPAALLATTGPEQLDEGMTLSVLTNGTLQTAGLETIGALALSGGTVNSATHRLRTGFVIVTQPSTWIGPELEMPETTNEIAVGPAEFSLRQTSLLSAGMILKTGTGRLVMGNHSVASLDVTVGELRAEGDTATGTIELSSGAIISGGGRVDGLDLTAGGTCRPGGAAGNALHVTTLTADPSGRLEPVLSAASPTSLTISGAAALGKMVLAPQATSLSTEQTFTIINKTSAGVISSRFTDTAGNTLEEGSLLRLAGRRLRLSYTGGNGNDITLTVLNDAPALSVTAFSADAVPAAPDSRRIRLTATGGIHATGLLFRLQTSRTLSGWTTLATATANSNGTASFDHTDTAATGPRKYYRIAIFAP